MKLGIALYTLRDRCKKDFGDVLKNVSMLGFNGVEFAGFFDISSKDMKAMLAKYKLEAISSHTPIEHIADKLDDIIKYNKEIGNTKIICPYYELKTKDDIQKLGEIFDNAKDEILSNNMELYYHNHDHEFLKIDGEYILDLLIARCPYLKIELDTYWAYKAGTDIDKYIQKHKNILDIVHIKDGNDKKTMAIGLGNAPIKNIMGYVKNSDIKWSIIENDTPNGDCLDDTKIGLENYKKYEKEMII